MSASDIAGVASVQLSLTIHVGIVNHDLAFTPVGAVTMVPAVMRHVSWLTLWALSVGRLDGSWGVAWSCAIARTGMTRVCNNEAAVLHLDE